MSYPNSHFPRQPGQRTSHYDPRNIFHTAGNQHGEHHGEPSSYYIPDHHYQPAVRPPSPLHHQRQSKWDQFYVVGKVLNVAIAKTVGDKIDPDSMRYLSKDCWGRDMLSKPRKCIIAEVRKGSRSIVVVPITSNGSQGFGKGSVDASDYAVVYTNITNAVVLPGEESKAKHMMPDAIRVKPDNAWYQLSPGSRIDYSKPETVEMYHESSSFGMVADEDMDVFLKQYLQARTPKPHTSGPQATVAVHKKIWPADEQSDASSGDNEVYCVQTNPEEFFKSGVVVQAVDWQESGSIDSEVTRFVAGTTASGRPIVRQPLYLVVIARAGEFCKCLRISTNQGRGATDLPKGLSTSDYALVHTGKDPPALLPEEVHAGTTGRGLFACIRVHEENLTEVLLPTARLCLTQVLEVRMDLKVKLFGHIRGKPKKELLKEYKARNAINPTSFEQPTEPTPSASFATDWRSNRPNMASRGFGMPSHSSFALQSTPGSSMPSPPARLMQSYRGPEPEYQEGDVVWLETGGPELFRLRVHSWRPVQSGSGSVWEYNLKHLHNDGLFDGGTFFIGHLLRRG